MSPRAGRGAEWQNVWCGVFWTSRHNRVFGRKDEVTLRLHHALFELAVAGCDEWKKESAVAAV